MSDLDDIWSQCENNGSEGRHLFYICTKITPHSFKETYFEFLPAVSQIYICRLLATKGTMQKFVDDLFEVFQNYNYHDYNDELHY